MTCDEVRRLLDAFVDGELDLAQQLDLETHLAGCPDCRAAVEQIANLSSLVRMNTEVYKAPRKLKSKIRTSLRQESEPKFAWFLSTAAHWPMPPPSWF
jgi:anti-sigma factor (TIGR02949 family)